MICPACSKAADLIKIYRDAPPAESVDQVLQFMGSEVPFKARVRTMIVLGHQDCPGGTWCDCQHKIPEEIAA